MKEEVKKDILSILEKVQIAIKEDNILEIKELSNHTLHDSSIFQDEYSVSIAVIIYSFGKIYERSRYREYKTWPIFHKSVVENLSKAYLSLKQDNILGYESAMLAILQGINKLEPKFQGYIKEVIEKAKIHKASRIHEHGISVSRTAALLGITEWELMEYVGETGISEVPLSITKRMSQRLKFVRVLFR